MTEEHIVTSTPDEGTEDFATMLAAQETVASQLQVGQKVTGTVIAISGDTVFVDVGIKVDGIMDRKDILDAEGKESVKPGDRVEAWVIGVSSQEIRLSRSMGGYGVAALEDAREAAVPVDGRITGVCKGGYTVEVLGKSAFCPGSQIGMAGVEDANTLVGRTLPFLVMRVENRGRNIVVSHRAFTDRERAEHLESFLAQVSVGDMVEGRITRLAPFGAFVELAPSVEGMIHISELSWSRHASPEEAVSLGDTVRAKVLSLSKDAKGQVRIALSRKQAEDDPWQHVSERLLPDAIVQGKVVRLVDFGAFVELLPGIEGLVHISELSWKKRITKPEEVLAVGDSVSVKIKDINLETRRISLSLRDAEGDPWQDVVQQFAVGSVVTGTVESRTRYGLFVTLAPGVTGLLPAAVIKTSKTAKQLEGLDKGDSVTLLVQNVDIATRRISLAPEGAHVQGETDTSWKQHARTDAAVHDSGMTLMAQALQKALQKK